MKIINNDAYGAPELKRVYQKHTVWALTVAISVHLILCAFIFMSPADATEDNKTHREVTIVSIDTPPSIDEIEKKIVEEVQSKLNDLSSLQPVPVSRDQADELTIKTQDELNAINNSEGEGKGDSLVAYNDESETKIVEDKIDVLKIDEEKTVYENFEVEVVPTCVNLAQIRSNMEYPVIAIEGNIEGKVTCKVLVSEDGQVEKISKLTGPEVFHEEVRSKASLLRFTPGLQNNRPVKVWVTIPFNFQLK